MATFSAWHWLPSHHTYLSPSSFPLPQLFQAAAAPSGVKYINQNVRIMENPTLPRSLPSQLPCHCPPCTRYVDPKHTARKTPIRAFIFLIRPQRNKEKREFKLIWPLKHENYFNNKRAWVSLFNTKENKGAYDSLKVTKWDNGRFLQQAQDSQLKARLYSISSDLTHTLHMHTHVHAHIHDHKQSTHLLLVYGPRGWRGCISDP